jgi:hypothetical protein
VSFLLSSIKKNERESILYFFAMPPFYIKSSNTKKYLVFQMNLNLCYGSIWPSTSPHWRSISRRSYSNVYIITSLKSLWCQTDRIICSSMPRTCSSNFPYSIYRWPWIRIHYSKVKECSFSPSIRIYFFN